MASEKLMCVLGPPLFYLAEIVSALFRWLAPARRPAGVRPSPDTTDRGRRARVREFRPLGTPDFPDIGLAVIPTRSNPIPGRTDAAFV